MNILKIRDVVMAYGESKPIEEWAKIVGLASSTIVGRINTGWSIEDALTMPLLKKGAKVASPNSKKQHPDLITAFGTSKTASEWSKLTGIPANTIRSRVYSYNRTPEDAITDKKGIRWKKSSPLSAKVKQ